MEEQIVRAATYVHASFEEVWKALTRPERQAEWYIAPCLDFGWEPGERVAWGRDGALIIEGRVASWQPATSFAHTFELTRLDEPTSFVEWQVLPQGEVVWVEVKHHFPDEAPETQAIVTDGWTVVLARLKTLLETGEPMPWPEWEESEEA
ncbi:MAG: SRPBCC domain-containing protein [Chloroflexota bacterium]|nr:SRPBCC domain-containing protein [Chloroflexota bacterium]